MRYPIQVIEQHHDGRVLNWTLYDRKHLIEITTNARARSDYTGELDDLDDYFDWLRSDLASLATAEADAC